MEKKLGVQIGQYLMNDLAGPAKLVYRYVPYEGISLDARSDFNEISSKHDI